MQEKFIQIEEIDGETKWTLPYRKLGTFRNTGWLVLLVGGIVTLFMVGWISGPMIAGIELLNQGLAFGWLPIAFGLLGVPGFFFAFRLNSLALRILKDKTRCEVSIKGKKLVSTEMLGWFSWKRKVALDAIDELIIEDGKKKANRNNGSSLTGPLPDGTRVLTAKCNGKDFLVMLAYPEETTQDLANQLSAEIGKSLSIANPMTPAEMKAGLQVANVPVTVGNSETPTIPTQPIDSKIVIHDTEDGTLAYEVPPTGMTKGSKGIFGFACIWLTFCLLIFGSMVFGEFDDALSVVVVVSFALVFIGTGVGLLLAAINMGRRSTMLGISKDQLFIERKSIFGTKWLEYNRNEIRKFEVAPSGVEVNDEPVYELKILTHDGESKGLLGQLTDEELEWLAHSLNGSLGVSEERVAGCNWRHELRHLDSEKLQLPEKSKIEIVNSSVNRLTMKIPKRPEIYLVPIIFSGIFVAAGIILFAVFSEWIIGFFLSLSGIVGIFASTYWTLRSFDINATADRLEITRNSPWGSKSYCWNRRAITEIDLHASGIKSNEQEVYQLRIEGAPESLNLMSYSPKSEIAVVAGMLNQVLDLHPKPTILESKEASGLPLPSLQGFNESYSNGVSS